MAGKTKKKSAKKPAKKTAKKAPAKKVAKGAKKAAPKKAAAKKAAPKKAAPKKAPPAKKPAKKAPKETVEVIEVAGAKASLQTEILAMARELYGANRTDEELLAFDPNDVDAMDPSMFYELLGEKYGVAADPDNDYFGGFGGTIAKTIAFVEARWDGTTRKDTPMPPGDWLEEYVHGDGGTSESSTS